MTFSSLATEPIILVSGESPRLSKTDIVAPVTHFFRSGEPFLIVIMRFSSTPSNIKLCVAKSAVDTVRSVQKLYALLFIGEVPAALPIGLAQCLVDRQNAPVASLPASLAVRDAWV